MRTELHSYRGQNHLSNAHHRYEIHIGDNIYSVSCLSVTLRSVTFESMAWQL